MNYQEIKGTVGYMGRYYPKSQKPQDFFTLHQLAGKIVFNQYGWSDFKGLDMYQLVEISLQKTFGVQPSRESIVFYYDLIRLHKNKTISVKEFPHGETVLKHYEFLLDFSHDFESIFYNASWVLKNSTVTQLNRFSFQNIILLEPNTLNQPNNQNALAFCDEFSKWAITKGINIFTQKNKFEIEPYHYEKGIMQ